MLAPEVYHDVLPAGTVLSYSPEDTARGNAAKTARPRAAYDGDSAAAVAALRAHASCTGAVGAAGVCLGGGLAFRCAVTIWMALMLAPAATSCIENVLLAFSVLVEM